MATLDEIGLRHGTDKASNHHGYLSFYEGHFSQLRFEMLSILEVGVLEGASLRMWEEYFPKAKILGVDLNPMAKYHHRGRVSIEIIDQSNVEELTQIALKHGPFDIIIEDGSHFWEHQVTALRTLFPFIKNRGYYVVEDLQTNYGSMKDNFRGNATTTCIDYLKCLVDTLVGHEQVPLENIEDAFLRTYGRSMEFLTFHRHACLIKKNFSRIQREHYVGIALMADDKNHESLTVRIIAHVGDKGDVVGSHGFVNLGFDRFAIQGFCLSTDEPIIEYKIFEDGASAWSDWCESGKFVGSRGQSRPLIGFSVQLKRDFVDKYRLRVCGRFAGLAQTLEVSHSEECRSPSGTALCGMEIRIYPSIL